MLRELEATEREVERERRRKERELVELQATAEAMLVEGRTALQAVAYTRSLFSST
jgi:hypothetical protein